MSTCVWKATTTVSMLDVKILIEGTVVNVSLDLKEMGKSVHVRMLFLPS